jgi:hypothetical protein
LSRSACVKSGRPCHVWLAFTPSMYEEGPACPAEGLSLLFLGSFGVSSSVVDGYEHAGG